MKKISRRNFVAAAASVGAGAALRTPAFAFNGPVPVAAVAANVEGHEVVTPQVSPFPLKNVRLQPGAFSAAAEANRKYLKTLPPDRLLHTFRLTARIANCADTSPAGTTFRLVRWRLPIQAMKSLSVTAISWWPN
jgi:uncharacterized protein